jgi:hypothetical protein
MGYPMIDRLETEFLLPDGIERKYGSASASQVVREKH